jgi:hypothetical protein
MSGGWRLRWTVTGASCLQPLALLPPSLVLHPPPCWVPASLGSWTSCSLTVRGASCCESRCCDTAKSMHACCTAGKGMITEETCHQVRLHWALQPRQCACLAVTTLLWHMQVLLEMAARAADEPGIAWRVGVGAPVDEVSEALRSAPRPQGKANRLLTRQSKPAVRGWSGV